MNRHSNTNIERLIEVRARILACIQAGIELASEISEKSGVGTHTVTNNLIVLEREGVIHRERVKVAGPTGFYNRWKLGNAPESAANSRAWRGDEPRRILSKEYPVNHARDPLVAALFGAPQFQAPKQSAPVCTACGVEQGAGHNRGCIVALVAA